jgi:hypothetical protein
MFFRVKIAKKYPFEWMETGEGRKSGGRPGVVHACAVFYKSCGFLLDIIALKRYTDLRGQYCSHFFHRHFAGTKR